MKPEIPELDCVYPGKFVPEKSREKAYKALKHPEKNCMNLHCLVVKESSYLYEVQLSVPGMKREKLIVYGNDHSLLVNAPQNKEIQGNKKLNCRIPMPENADTELAIAEYKNGVLHLYIPKTEQHSKNVNTRIVVY